MPTPTTYINTLKDAAVSISGATAPTTGQYYNHIYSQNDPATGVPTLGVTLYNEVAGESQPAKNTNSAPVQLNNLTDMQILEMVQSGQQVGQNQPTRNIQTRPQQGSAGVTAAALSTNGDAIAAEQAEASAVPLGGIFTLILLLIFVGFVYFLIRIWQDHQAQKLVMTRIKTKTPVNKEGIVAKTELATTTEQIKEEEIQDSQILITPWRTELESVTKKLESLLEKKGVMGETVADKLKAIKPGQFALADLAWEAQQGAKTLLTAHDTDVSEPEIKRTLQLFKQVFAEHQV